MIVMTQSNVLPRPTIPEGRVPKGFELNSLRCRVHPAVVLTLLDADGRRSEGQNFVIGTLLGTISAEPPVATTPGGPMVSTGGCIVDVTDCFINAYNLDQDDALTIQKEHHEWMCKLKEKIAPKNVVVGWCYTTSQMKYTAGLNEWARSEQKTSKFSPHRYLPEPLHLLVRTDLGNVDNKQLAVKAYVRGTLGQLYHEVPVEIQTVPEDKPGVGLLLKSRDTQSYIDDTTAGVKTAVGREGFLAALENLLSLLRRAKLYVQDVLESGRQRETDAEVGRALMKAMCSEPLMDGEAFDSMCQNALQDNLMLAYLTNLAHLQFTIAEKLNTSFSQ